MRSTLNRYLFIALLSATPFTANSFSLNVNIDTSSLSGTMATLAFDFIDGDGTVNNTAKISSFITDGSFDTSLASSFGDVSGLLISSLTLADSGGFNEFLQPILLGNTLQFQLQLSDLFGSSALVPDAFSFFLLDEFASLPLFSTTDLTGSHALFAVDLTGDGNGLSVYASTSTNSRETWIVEAPSGTVPTPGTLSLILAGILSAVLSSNRRPVW